MKIYNKFVESKKEPSNKNDIWFDGSTIRLYKEGEWYTVTLSKEAIERLLQYAENVDIFKYVDELPEVGDPTFIYFKKEESNGNLIVLPYVYDGEWKQITNTEIFSKTSPFGFGNSENSAVLKGEYQGYSNKAISQTSIAVGAGTTAGLKGWYYSAIDFTNKTITLSDKPTYIMTGSNLIGGGWSSGTPNIKVNDVISLVNNSKYDFCSKVTAVNGNVVTVDKLPFTELVRDGGAAVAVIAGQFSDGYSLYIPERPDAGLIDFGGGAFSEGGQSKATNVAAHAEGFQTHAYGQFSHAEGRGTEAGYAAHAEGRETNATGEQSHTEGRQTTASGNCSHAEGEGTKAIGSRSHSEGYNTNASGPHSHAEGEGKNEGGNSFFLVGAHGRSSHVEGIATTTGEYNEQTGAWSKGDAAHAEGNLTIASGNHSHAEGSGTKASGWQAHAEGHNTIASGNRSHTEGSSTQASGQASHAEGENTNASGQGSHAEGLGTITNNLAEHAEGKYNKTNPGTIHSVGIGESKSKPKNAHEIFNTGEHFIIGIGGYDGTNPEPGVNDLATILNSPITDEELNELFNE